MNEILDDREVAAILDCDEKTVLDKARSGVLPGIKIGRSWRFPRQALLHVLNEMALKNTPVKPTQNAIKRAIKPPPDLSVISQALPPGPRRAG